MPAIYNLVQFDFYDFAYKNYFLKYNIIDYYIHNVMEKKFNLGKGPFLNFFHKISSKKLKISHKIENFRQFLTLFWGFFFVEFDLKIFFFGFS